MYGDYRFLLAPLYIEHRKKGFCDIFSRGAKRVIPTYVEPQSANPFSAADTSLVEAVPWLFGHGCFHRGVMENRWRELLLSAHRGSSTSCSAWIGPNLFLERQAR